MKPSIGRIVHYTLSEDGAKQINRRRTTSGSIAARVSNDSWPLGAQAHVGNPATVGDVVPLMIVCIFLDEYGPGVPGVNGQAILDGNDSLWVTSAREGTEPGQWFWPPRVE